ncbi:MAG: hypothetical protein QF442_03195, partial [Candidatus Peribacteraceae bacterium]|nr:hypothetical protein [Candidatus Peribacteraceae bacterium]
MIKLIKNLTLVVLPVLTLFLGMQIGISHESQRLDEKYDAIEESYSGGVGSGILVNDPKEEVDISLIWSVWRLMAKHYIAPEKLETTKMLHGATSGLVNAIGDPY